MLTDQQKKQALDRFKFFDADRCASLFHSDQPDDGLFMIQNQGKFPGVLMTSDTKWFLVKDQRPERKGAPMKSKAPPGIRPFLVDKPEDEPTEVLAVEGEGHIVALLSIGFKGVICAGGVNNFWADGANSKANRTRAYAGRSVRFLLDPDPAGRKAVLKAARGALECGAARVAIVDLPTEGQDVEDWLATFDERETALAALYQLISTTTWEGAKELEKREAAEQEDNFEFTQSARVFQQGDDEVTLIMMVYDPLTRLPALAVYGPMEDLDPELRAYQDVDHTNAARGWRVMERWVYDGTTYLPDPAAMQYLENGTLVLPTAPPANPMTSTELWAAVREFIQRWVMCADELYDVLVAYVLMSYRLEDGNFQHVPYLRFYGDPGTGKGRGLEVMASLCSRSFVSQPTVNNIHRVVEHFGFITMCFDEFHLDRGLSREAMHKMIETLNLGYKRGMGVIRVIDCPNGRGKTIQMFPLFGCKVFAGYGHDEDEALARRTVNVQMGGRIVPESMDLMCLPERFYQESATLRGELLAFRGRQLHRGMPDPEGPVALRLRQAGGTFVGQVFFPLVSMVPEGMEAELKHILDCAALRREEAQSTRETSEESYLLDSLASIIDDGTAHSLAKDAGLFITTEHLHTRSLDRMNVPLNTVARKLQAMGLEHSRRRVPSTSTGKTAPRGGFSIEGNSKALAQLMERYGIEWPRRSTANSTAAL